MIDRICACRLGKNIAGTMGTPYEARAAPRMCQKTFDNGNQREKPEFADLEKMLSNIMPLLINAPVGAKRRKRS